MSELQSQYDGNVKIVKLNVDNPASSAAIQKYHVRGTPSFVLFDRHGKVVSQLPGWPGREQVVRSFDQLVAQN